MRHIQRITPCLFRYLAIALLCMVGSGCDVGRPGAESSVFWKLSPGQHLMYRFTRTQFDDPSDKENPARGPQQSSFVASMIVTRRVSDTSSECDVSIKDIVSAPDAAKTASKQRRISIKVSDCYQYSTSGSHKVILSASGQVTVVSISEGLKKCLENAFDAFHAKLDLGIIASTFNMILPEVPSGPVVLGQTWSSAASIPYALGEVHLKRNYRLEAVEGENYVVSVNGSGSTDKPDVYDKGKEWNNSFVVSGKATFDTGRKMLTKAQIKVSGQTTFRDLANKLRSG